MMGVAEVVGHGVEGDLVNPCCLCAVSAEAVEAVAAELRPDGQGAFLSELIEIESAPSAVPKADTVNGLAVSLQQFAEFYFLL